MGKETRKNKFLNIRQIYYKVTHTLALYHVWNSYLKALSQKAYLKEDLASYEIEIYIGWIE